MSKRITFADELRFIREETGTSQEQAAARIPGLSVRTFQAWEAGRTTPPEWTQGLVIVALYQSITSEAVSIRAIVRQRIEDRRHPRARRMPVVDIADCRRVLDEATKPRPKRPITPGEHLRSPIHGEVIVWRVTATKVQVTHTTEVWNGRMRWLPIADFTRISHLKRPKPKPKK